MSISCGPCIGSRAGAAAAAADPVEIDAVRCGSVAGAVCAGSGSRMSAPSPRPKAFLGIGNYLLGELCIALRPLTVHVIENNRFTETWGFSQPYVARNHTLKHLRSEKTTQVGGNLPRKRGALI